MSEGEEVVNTTTETETPNEVSGAQNANEETPTKTENESENQQQAEENQPQEVSNGDGNDKAAEGEIGTSSNIEEGKLPEKDIDIDQQSDENSLNTEDERSGSTSVAPAAAESLSQGPTVTEKGVSMDDRALWMTRAMEDDSELLELRERTRDWYDMHSFGYLKHADFSTCSAHLDRYRVLQLIYQHLNSIGLHHVADSLAVESQLEFQRKDQPMDRTDLRLLVSLSLGPRDNLWDTTGIESTNLVTEEWDADNDNYRFTGPLDGCTVDNYMSEMEFKDGAKDQKLEEVATTTLHGLACALVWGDEAFISNDILQMVFSMINSITTNAHFFAHLSMIYIKSDDSIKTKVITLIGKWVAHSGVFIGKRTLSGMKFFLEAVETEEAQNILKSIDSILNGKTEEDNYVSKCPSVEVEDAAALLNPNLSLAEPSPVEVARQITLIEHKLFAGVNPREFYSAVSHRSLSQFTPGLVHMMEFGRRLKHLVVATIVAHENVKTPLVEFAAKQMERAVRIAEELLKLNNFEAVSWVVSALRTRAVENLTGSLALLDESTRETVARLKRDFAHDAPSEAYEALIGRCTSDELLPALPSVRYELAQTAAPLFGGDDFPGGRINIAKRLAIGAFSARLERLQHRRYYFIAVAQIQDVLARGTPLTKQQLEKASLEIEGPVKADA